MKLENVKLNLDTELMYNVGCPINKTNAPRCYNKLFEVLDMNMIMLPCEIQKGQLPQFLDACRLTGVHYLAPTMPHKGDFVELMDEIDETSKLFHSVNAVRIDPDGSTHGAGMDGKGAVRAMLNGGAKLDGIEHRSVRRRVRRGLLDGAAAKADAKMAPAASRPRTHR